MNVENFLRQKHVWFLVSMVKGSTLGLINGLNFEFKLWGDPCIVMGFGFDLCTVTINSYGIIACGGGGGLIYNWCLMWVFVLY
jgi:hypothetical protein